VAILLVDCSHCHTTLRPMDQKCPVCGTPRLGATQTGEAVNITYLEAAIRKIPTLISDEESATIEYEDNANMVAMGGSSKAAEIFRRIAQDEKRHVTELREAEAHLKATVLRERMKR